MRRLVVVLSLQLLSLTACSDREADARKRLAIIKAAGGSPAEICREARAMQEAALAKGDASHFSEVHVEADIECFDFDHGHDRRYDELQPDNLQAMKDTTESMPLTNGQR